MTSFEGSEESAVAFVDVAASAAGLEDAFTRIGRNVSERFRGAVRAGTANLGPEMLAGLDDSTASLAGAKFGEVVGKAIAAPITLARAAFTGLSRDGAASADSLNASYNAVTDSLRKATAQVHALNAEARDASAAGGAFDSTRILSASTAVEGFKRQQSELADQIKGVNDAARSAGGGFDTAAFKASVMGGATALAGQVGLESFEDLFEKVEEVGEKLLDVGEIAEAMNRQLLVSTTASGEGLESLKNTIGEVASGTSASFQSITTDAAVLSQRLGLDGGPLKQLTQQVADAGVLIGQPLDVSAFAGSVRALGVPAEQASGFLDQLFSISKATAVSLPDLIEQLQRNGAVLKEFNIPAGAAASLLAQMQAAGVPASAAMRGLTSVVRDAHKEHLTFGDDLKRIVGGIEAARKAGDEAAEDGWAEKLGSKAGPQFARLVDEGVISVQSLSAALSDVNGDGITDVYDKTQTLSDRLSAFGHEIDTALAPVGEAITSELGGAFTFLSDWVATHGDQIVGWFGTLGDVALQVFGQMEKGLGAVVSGFGQLEVGIGMLTGDKGLQDAGHDAEHLGDAMTKAGNNIGATIKTFDDFIARTKASVAVTEDLTAALKLTSDGKLVIKDNSPEVRQHLDDLKKAGIDVTTGPDGQAHVTADDPEQAKRAQEWLKNETGKDVDVPVVAPPPPPPDAPPPAPAPPPPPDPNSNGTTLFDGGTIRPGSVLDWLQKNLFNPDHPLIGPQPDKPTPSPRDFHPFHPSGDDTDVPAKISVQPAGFKIPTSDVLTSAGVPDRLSGPDGVVFPAVTTIGDGDRLDPSDTMRKAGVPDPLIGTIPNTSADGVVMPTGFDVKDGERKSVSDLMQNVGIPSENQGPTGVVLSVDFTTGTNSSVTMPTGFPGGGSPGAPGVPGGGGGPITSDGTPNGNATAIIQAAAQRGFTPEQTQAILATGLDESGLNQGAVSPNGLWKGVFQQDSGYPNRDDAAGNIQGFFDRLGPPSGDTWEKIFALQQGTPYGAPNARNAYMGEIKSKLPEAQSLYAQLANSANTAPGGGGGSAPAPGGGDGSYAGVAATDNASTSDPRHGGIPGAPSGEGQDLLAYMKQVMDGFNAQTGAHLSVMADYPGGPKGHPDDGADHSVRRALDIAGTSQEMDAFAAMIANNPALRDITRQLIHNPQNDGGPFTADMNVIGGREVNGWQVYGSGPEGMPGHADHDHWALQDLPGGGGSGPGVTNAGYTVGGQPGIVDVDKVTPDPNAPDPAAPGVPNVGADPLPGGPPTTPPPVPNPSALQAPAGAPNAVQTPYGTFEHTPAMTPDQQALLSPEQKYKFDEWLDKYVSSLETATDTQDTINRDQERVDKALKRKNDADAAVLPGDDETAAAAQQADQEYVDAQADLAKSKRHQTDETNRQATAAEKPASDSKDKPDQNAEDFGRGFLGGVASDLGFGNVFGGKTPDKWGIVQLLGHLGGFGMGLLEGGDKSTGGDTSTPSAGSGSVAQGGLIGIVESIFPGLKDILGKANNGTPPAPPTDAAPGGAPANIPSSSGAVQPAGRQGDDTGGPSTTTNQNLQVNNTYQGFNPSPQTKDQIRTVSNYTSAAQMSGGGGILL